jgi:hypothetical protein
MCLQVVSCVRQPSQGPTFGIKGGAAGGGYSQVTEGCHTPFHWHQIIHKPIGHTCFLVLGLLCMPRIWLVRVTHASVDEKSAQPQEGRWSKNALVYDNKI